MNIVLIVAMLWAQTPQAELRAKLKADQSTFKITLMEAGPSQYICRGNPEIFIDGKWVPMVVPCLPEYAAIQGALIAIDRAVTEGIIIRDTPQPIPAKPWRPEMCTTLRDRATADYISYCIKNSPNKYPACVHPVNTPRDAMSLGSGGSYLEVLDCSWKPGKNPRDK